MNNNFLPLPDRYKAVAAEDPKVDPITPAEPTPTTVADPQPKPVVPATPPVADPVATDPVIPVAPVDEPVTFESLMGEPPKKETPVQFANPFVEQMNLFFANGGTHDEFIRLTEFQRRDFAAMNDLEVVIAKVEKDYPSLSKEEAEAYARSTLGSIEAKTEGDVTTPADAAALARLKIQADQSRAELQSLKEQYAIPAAMQLSKEQQLQQEQAKMLNSRLVSHVVESNSHYNSEVKDGDNLLSSIKVQVPDAIKASVQESLVELMAASNVVVGKENFQEVSKNVQEWTQKLLMTHMGQDLLTAAVKDAEARTRAKVIAEMSGMAPKPVGGQAASSTSGDPIKKLKQRMAS